MYKGQIPKNARCIEHIAGTLEGKGIQAWLYRAEVSLGCQSNYKKIPSIFIEVWYGDPRSRIKKSLWRYTGKEAREAKETRELDKWHELKEAIIEDGENQIDCLNTNIY